MRVTLREVAKASGYAHSTVSHVLNNRPSCFASKSAREKILDAAARLGYRPNPFARALREGRSCMIGVMLAVTPQDILNIEIAAIRETLGDKGYFPLLARISPDGKDFQAVANEVLSCGVDGLIILSRLVMPLVSPVLKTEIPTVLVTSRVSNRIPQVHLDYATAVEHLVGRMIENGHHRIAFVTRDPSRHWAKIHGYRRRMREAGLGAQVFTIPPEVASVTKFMDKMSAKLLPMTAIFSGIDQTAAEIMEALQRMGKHVPEDCMVVGFGNSDVCANVHPTLTSFKPPRREIGEAAASMIMDLLNGKSIENKVIIPELMERESTGSLLPAKM